MLSSLRYSAKHARRALVVNRSLSSTNWKDSAAQNDWLDNHGSTDGHPLYKNWVDGKFVSSAASEWIDLYNPATNAVVAKVPQATTLEMNAAVQSAKDAFQTWKHVSIQQRQRVDRKSVV